MPPSKLHEEKKKLNNTIAWILVAMVILFFVATVVKLGANVYDRPL